ncbi:MAG: recombination protein O N-terminal domain-containing protein [Pseudomonadales bacterium]|nr:recombination protein O N-terminal domain-containing protein [Pseudomonadales bacterium]
MNVNDKKAFVLHIRSYRENSYLLELFAEDKGRFSAIARGQKNRIQMFTPYSITTMGKTDLKSIKVFEVQGSGYSLSGKRLFSAMYLNEVIYRCLPKALAENRLFSAYQATLLDLSDASVEVGKSLRCFEFLLFETLGFALFPDEDLASIFRRDNFYRFVGAEGFVEVRDEDAAAVDVFSGQSLLAIAAYCFDNPESVRDGKRLARLAFRYFFEINEFKSRRLFIN